jgi:hypothetical protein
MRIMPFLAARFVLPLAMLTLVDPVVLGAQTLTAVGERAEGMGGAFVAVADDSSTTYWNPAGLAWPTGSTFDAQLNVGGPGTAAVPGAGRPVLLAAAMPALGISYYRLAIADGGGPLPTVSGSGGRQNEGSGGVRPRALTTNNFGVTVNQSIANALVIGSTLRLVNGAAEQVPGRTAFDIDLGALVSLGKVRVGVTARNVLQPEFPGELIPFPLERQVRAGVALVPRTLSRGVHGPLSVAFDADLTKARSGSVDRREAAIGGEYWVGGGALGVRGGMRWSTLEDPNPAFSSGLTVKLPRSLFADGHLTKLHESDDLTWGLGLRITF